MASHVTAGSKRQVQPRFEVAGGPVAAEPLGAGGRLPVDRFRIDYVSRLSMASRAACGSSEYNFSISFGRDMRSSTMKLIMPKIW